MISGMEYDEEKGQLVAYETWPTNERRGVSCERVRMEYAPLLDPLT